MERSAYKFRCEFSVGDAIGTAIIFLLVLILTLGLAAFVLPYYLPKAVINRTTVLADDGSEIGTLKCDLKLGTMIGNALIWVLLTVITLGFAYIVYVFRVQRIVLSETKIVYNSPRLAGVSQN
ncbi:DUF6693 family protein [Ruegeria atlantica]|uniref:Putative membrane protein n=1 Tax=Ruegeria atlantica TaxID=81569 RepID=A0A0P1E4S1_9RHOB|nr:DUF6693 family protein [Ruegeria atlantica]CUH42242.1 putative membrane protein [Ruegeria atlantica]